MRDLDLYTHGFKVHAPNLLEETIMNAVRPKDREALRIPLIIFARYLDSIATRCSQIDDPILNRLMVEMSIFSVGDPASEDYDKEVINEVIAKAKDYLKEQK